MLKWLRTKRGFTLVEVMVAFVIFAIMAAMVTTIMLTINKTKQGNLELEREIEAQRNAYYLSEQDTEYDSGTDTLGFKFDGVDEFAIKYDVEDANPDTYNGLALQYPVGNVDYENLEAPIEDEDDDEKGGSGVTDRMDSRIYGDEAIDYVGIRLEKDTTYTGKGYRYLVYTTAKASLYGNDTTNEYCWYSQYRVVFPSPIIDYGYFEQEADGTITEKGREEKETAKAGVSIIHDVFCPGRKINLIYDQIKDEETGDITRGSVLLHGGVIRIASLVSGSAATVSQLHEYNLNTRFYVVLENELTHDATDTTVPAYKKWNINDLSTIFGTSGDSNGDGICNINDLQKMSDLDSEYEAGGDLDEFKDHYVYGHYDDGTSVHKNVFGGYPSTDYVPST